MTFPSLLFSPLFRQVNEWTTDIYHRSASHFNFMGSGFTKTDTGYALELMVPGFQKNEIEIQLSDQEELYIKGTSEHTKQSRAFSQHWALPKDADSLTLSATLENGILTIAMERKQREPTLRRIYIV